MPRFNSARLRVLRLVLVFILAVGAFASIVLLSAALFAWWQDRETLSGFSLSLGVICGLTVWLFLAVFHINRETITLPFDDPDAFRRRVRSHLEKLGYVVTAPSDSVLVARPLFLAPLFGGNVVVRMGRGQAVLIGPKMYLEGLRKGCRVHNHLEQVHQTLARGGQRPGEALLSQAEIRLQLPGEALAEVFRELAAVLAREGATMECDLFVRARSETGLRERIIDRQVCDLLTERQVRVLVKKEPMDAAGELKPPGDEPAGRSPQPV